MNHQIGKLYQKKIKSDRTQIVTVLNRIAKRNFVRKEFGMNKDQIKSIEKDYQIDEEVSLEDNSYYG